MRLDWSIFKGCDTPPEVSLVSTTVMKPILVLFSCLLASTLAAPQLRPSRQVLQSPVVAPQLVHRGRYIQPQLIRAQPQVVSRLPLQYSHLDDSHLYSPGGQLAYRGLQDVRTAPIPPQQFYRPAIIPGAAARSPAILRQAQDLNFDGTYQYGFESEDGIAVQASAGPLTAVGPDDAVQTVAGSFSYTAPDGTPITTNWIADENGFRADGAHLPRAPEGHYRTV